MKKETFDYLWENEFWGILKTIEKRCLEIDQENRYNFTLKECKKLKCDISAGYHTARNVLKRNYYIHSDDNDKIDHHKIAACLCLSVLQNKPFTFKISKGMPNEILLSNYKAAYSISKTFVFLMLIAQYRAKGLDHYASALEARKVLAVPETSTMHDDYDIGREKALALTELYEKQFNVLAYADMMFWIEYYNRQLVENTLHPVKLYEEEKES